MRTLVLAAALSLGLAGAGWAQGTGALIRGVIEGQIEAFRADDFETAFTYASPVIRDIFETPERFGRMVRDGYPMVWRPGDVEFTALSERSGRMYQTVLITDQAGKLHLLEYEMVMRGESWEINGVRFKRPGALGA